MIGFLDIKKIVMPFHCIEVAYTHMRKAGTQRVEGVALFAGKESGHNFEIETTIIPKQQALRLESGLLYAVDSDELHRINVWLYENKMSLIAQIHSHPTEAYHSDTDDAFPIVATVGGLSVVVPDFASGPIEIDTWAVYRLSPKSIWMELSRKETMTIIDLRK
jgi:proteasome lid subunit RPN8/RPN11